jgi:hypothetical protein
MPWYAWGLLKIEVKVDFDLLVTVMEKASSSSFQSLEEAHFIPPPRLERGLLPPEGSALSTELWGLASA